MTSDAVLVRNVDSERADELIGAAALVWVAAESPCTRADLCDMTQLSADVVQSTIELLDESGLLERVEQ